MQAKHPHNSYHVDFIVSFLLLSINPYEWALHSLVAGTVVVMIHKIQHHHCGDIIKPAHCEHLRSRQVIRYAALATIFFIIFIYLLKVPIHILIRL